LLDLFNDRQSDGSVGETASFHRNVQELNDVVSFLFVELERDFHIRRTKLQRPEPQRQPPAEPTAAAKKPRAGRSGSGSGARRSPQSRSCPRRSDSTSPAPALRSTGRKE